MKKITSIKNKISTNYIPCPKPVLACQVPHYSIHPLAPLFLSFDRLIDIIKWLQLEDRLVPNPLACAGTLSTRPGRSEPLPTWHWTVPEMRAPQYVWATCSCALYPIPYHSFSLQPQLYNVQKVSVEFT